MGNIVPFLPPPLPLLPHVGDLTSVLVISKHSFPCQVTSDIMVPIKKPTGKQDVDLPAVMEETQTTNPAAKLHLEDKQDPTSDRRHPKNHSGSHLTSITTTDLHPVDPPHTGTRLGRTRPQGTTLNIRGQSC